MPPHNEVPGAVLLDRAGRIAGGWELTEPDLIRHFAGRSVAYFEAEKGHGDDWHIIACLPDQHW